MMSTNKQQEKEAQSYLDYLDQLTAETTTPLLPDGSVDTDSPIAKAQAKYLDDDLRSVSPKIQEAKRLLSLIENKRDVSHVATPEGVARFHLPIGSPIVERGNHEAAINAAVSVPKPPAILRQPEQPTDYDDDRLVRVENDANGTPFILTHRGKRIARINNKPNGYMEVTIPDKLVPIGSTRTLEENRTYRLANAATEVANTAHFVRRPANSPNMSWNRNSDHRPSTAIVDADNRIHQFEVTGDSSGHLTVVRSTLDPQTNNKVFLSQHPMKTNSQAEATRIIKAWVEHRNKIITRNVPVDAKNKNFAGYYVGVHGVDYEHTELPDPKGQERFDTIGQHADYLGVHLGGNLSMDTMETVNAVLQTYDGMYPGFSLLAPVWNGTWPGGRNGHDAYASNHPLSSIESALLTPHRHVLMGDRDTGRRLGPPEPDMLAHIGEVDYGGSYLRLGEKFFGRNFSKDTVTEEMKKNSESNWFAGTFDQMKDNLADEEDWRVGQIYVINHELGHTLVDVAAQKLAGPNENPDQASLNAIKFWDDMRGYLDKWGVIAEDANKPMVNPQLQGGAVVDKQSMRALLSEYGGTNLHEMCAEAWAEYQTHAQPRAFATGIAKIMETYLKEHMAEMAEAGY